jgi:hypothetical protein
MTYLSGNLNLPSASTAADLLDGKPGALLGMIGCTLGRGILVATGVYLAGFRGKQLIKASLAAALAIEGYVLAYAIYDRSKGI